MFTVRIKPNTLEHRLDCGFYNPNGLIASATLSSHLPIKPLSLLVDRERKITNGVRGPDWADSCFKLIRLQDCEHWTVNDRDAASITARQFEENRRCKLQLNDVVVAIGGYIGNAAIVVEPCQAVIGQHSAILPDPEKENTDSRFLLAYLNCHFAKDIFSRYVSGTVQAGINLEDLRDLAAPTPVLQAQKYIGDKVRQAEQLRAWAKYLRKSVDLVLDALALPVYVLPQMLNRVPSALLDTRLDPRPYRTHYTGLVNQIKNIPNNPVSKMAELSSGCPVSSDDFIEAGEVLLVRIRNIGFDEFIGLDIGVSKAVYAEEIKYHANENMIVLGMDGIFRAQFFLIDELPLLVNQRVAMLEATDIRAELLTHWLNRAEGQMQLNQWAVKTTVEHTSLSDIGRVRIPRLFRTIEDELADKLLNARRAYRYSRFLTTSARLLVEALIEAQIDENLLISAQVQLQASDNSLDRSIMARLKTDGLDGKGQPLFPDIDQLYALLTQAAQA
jgi:type I restriction enzyme S subunit